MEMQINNKVENVAVRLARPDDATRLTSVALEAKASWGYPQAWLDRWTDELTITRRYIEQHAVWVAEEDQHVLGFAAVERTEGHLTLGHLWVRPGHHGRGVGRLLIETAVEHAAREGHGSLEVVSDPNAAPFYERLGGRLSGWVDAGFGEVDRRLPVFRIPIRGRDGGAKPEPAP